MRIYLCPARDARTDDGAEVRDERDDRREVNFAVAKGRVAVFGSKEDGDAKCDAAIQLVKTDPHDSCRDDGDRGKEEVMLEAGRNRFHYY